MKELWVRADQETPWDRRKKLITTALENGATAVVIKTGETGKAKQLGKINTASDDSEADICLSDKYEELAKAKNKRAYYKDIKNKSDEKDVTACGQKADYVVIKASDWKVIPLENIIASLKGKTRIIVETKSREDAKTALETLETGADGILYAGDAADIKKIKDLVDAASSGKFQLTAVKIKK